MIKIAIGKVDFAILEDRKFKTGPKGLVPPMGPRPDHISDPDYDYNTVDLPEGKILGDRQLRFLDEWGQNWEGVHLKAVLSQTIFANAAHRHGKYDYLLFADMDSNGWPQSARNRAIASMRKFFGFHIAGDQHLATVIHHGINQFRDAGFSFCVPSIVNYYNRWWSPGRELTKFHTGVGLVANHFRFVGIKHDSYENKNKKRLTKSFKKKIYFHLCSMWSMYGDFTSCDGIFIFFIPKQCDWIFIFVLQQQENENKGNLFIA